MAEALGVADFVEGFDQETLVVFGGVFGLAVILFSEAVAGDEGAGARNLGFTVDEGQDGDVESGRSLPQASVVRSMSRIRAVRERFQRVSSSARSMWTRSMSSRRRPTPFRRDGASGTGSLHEKRALNGYDSLIDSIPTICMTIHLATDRACQLFETRLLSDFAVDRYPHSEGSTNIVKLIPPMLDPLFVSSRSQVGARSIRSEIQQICISLKLLKIVLTNHFSFVDELAPRPIEPLDIFDGLFIWNIRTERHHCSQSVAQCPGNRLLAAKQVLECGTAQQEGHVGSIVLSLFAARHHHTRECSKVNIIPKRLYGVD